jgi:hypothetical protein
MQQHARSWYLDGATDFKDAIDVVITDLSVWI